METYRIVRFFQDSRFEKSTVKTGLTLEEAKTYCNDPETNSRTATSKESKQLTEWFGAWFCGYEEE